MNRDVESYFDQLDDNEFFSRFTTEQLSRIKNSSKIHQYPKDQIIFFEGDNRLYCYYILKGLVKLESSTADGEKTYLDYVGQGAFFPYGDFLNSRLYFCNGIAATNLDLMLIPTSIIEDCVSENAEQLVHMYKKACSVITYLEKRIQIISNPIATERVVLMLALWMIDMGREAGDYIEIPYALTVKELAIMAGTTRETASRTVNRLKNEHLIDFDRNGIKFVKPEYFDELLK